MEVISNHNLIESMTSAIDSVWFCKSSIDKNSINENNSLDQFIKNVINGYNDKSDVYIKYYIDLTNEGAYPRLYGLMEYNKIPVLDYPKSNNSTDILNFNNERHYIGEYYVSDVIITSKVIFPKKLIEDGYNTAIIFQDKLEEEITANTKSLPWKYILVLDESGIDRVTNNIIQFSNDSSEIEEVFTHIHESNYSNPHADQIARIPTESETSNPVSFSEYNNLITNTNSIVIKNYLVSEDYSVIYLGDQLDNIDEFEWGR